MQLFQKPEEQDVRNLLAPLQETEEREETLESVRALRFKELVKETALLVNTSKSRETKIAYYMVAVIIMVAITVGIDVWLSRTTVSGMGWLNSFLPPTLFTMTCLPLIQLIRNVTSRRKQGATLVKEIVLREQADTIPLLIDILTSDCTNKKTMFRIRKALTELLPVVREEDAPSFKARHVQYLNAALTRIVASVHGEPPPELEQRVAIVRALAYVGDEQSLESLRRWSDKGSAEFRAVVQEVVPVLEKRVERLKDHGTLLRASSAPLNSDTLLRPAYASPQEPEQELLRPVDGE